MYDWLQAELDQVRTRRFHLVNAEPLPAAVKRPFISGLRLPDSYVQFVKRFGNARLFRFGLSYQLRVSARPWILVDDSRFVCIGGHDDRDAYLDTYALQDGLGESPIYEGHHHSDSRRMDHDFASWIERKYKLCRSSFSESEWKAIQHGPKPFSKAELQIVEARRLFRWKCAGKNPQSSYVFDIHNQSQIVLPFLSIGARATDGSFEGGLKLRTSHILPGTRDVASHRGYSDTRLSSEVEFFDLPDPEPEERDRYWEFRKL